MNTLRKFLFSLLSLLLITCPVLAAQDTPVHVFDPDISPTTGLRAQSAYQPFVVNLDNEDGARPIYGIAAADVVYEMPVYNGGYTRYTAVFNDTLPDFVEGVRSARIVHVDISREWGGAFVYAGVQEYEGTNVYDYLKKIKVARSFDLQKGSGKGVFSRDSERKSPHNVRFNMKEAATPERYNLTPELRSPLYFSAENPTLGTEEVVEFAIRYRKDYLPSYLYDEETKTYTRSYNWEPMLDADGSAVTCQNIIVMRVQLSWYDGKTDAPVYRMTRGGTCDYFIGGTHFTGTWERARIAQNTIYYDDEGNIVRFLPGKTFIQILGEKDKTPLEIIG